MNEVRLIDANALKFKNVAEVNGKLTHVLLPEEIANAPTVEQPQGEWIDYSDEGYIECPFCGNATTCEDNKDELHYCWHCGAKLS